MAFETRVRAAFYNDWRRGPERPMKRIMDPRQKRLMNDTRRMRQLALARGDVRAAHACNVTIAALRRAARVARP